MLDDQEVLTDECATCIITGHSQLIKPDAGFTVQLFRLFYRAEKQCIPLLTLMFFNGFVLFGIHMIATPRLLKITFIMIALLPHLAFGTMPSLNNLIHMGCWIDEEDKTITFKPGDIKYTDGNQPYFMNGETTYYLTRYSTGDNTYRVSGIQGGWFLQVFDDSLPNLMQESTIEINQNASTFIMPDTHIPPPEFTCQSYYPQESMNVDVLILRHQEEVKQLNKKLACLSTSREQEKKTNQKLEQDLAKSKEEAENLKGEIFNLEEKIKAQANQTMQAEEKHQSTQYELEKTNIELLDKNINLEHQLKIYDEKNAKSREAICTHEKKIRQLQKEKEFADKKNNEHQGKIDRQKHEINKLTDQNKKNKQTVTDLTECKSKMTEKDRLIALLKDKVSGLNAELSKLRDDKKKHEQISQEYKEQLGVMNEQLGEMKVQYRNIAPDTERRSDAHQQKSKIDPEAPPTTDALLSLAQKVAESLIPRKNQQLSEAEKIIKEQSRQLEEQRRKLKEQETELCQFQAFPERKEDRTVPGYFDPFGRLEELGVVAEHTPGDGACLLHAVTQGLEETRDTTAFNELLVEYILSDGQNWQVFAQHVTSLDGASSQELLNQLLNLQAPSAGNPEHWADHRLFALIAVFLQRPVLLVLANGALGHHGEDPLIAIQFSPDASTTPDYLGEISTSQLLQNPEQSNTLLIGFIQAGKKGNGNHFFQLKRK